VADKILDMLSKRTGQFSRPDRRTDHRLLCSSLIQISWLDADDCIRREMVVLEDISNRRRGMAVFVSSPIEPDTLVNILVNNVALRGYVRRCSSQHDGYLVGLELDEKCQLDVSSLERFIPEHLIDVDQLKLD
jgi:hypothetical protein